MEILFIQELVIKRQEVKWVTFYGKTLKWATSISSYDGGEFMRIEWLLVILDIIRLIISLIILLM